MKRIRLLAVTHDYSLTGAPVNFFHLMVALSKRYEITVASEVNGPLREQFTERGLGGMVIPGLLKDLKTAEGVLTSFDGLVANTILAFNTVLAAASIPKPSVWMLQEAGSWDRFVGQNSPLLRLALGSATTVVSTSQYTVGLYRRWRNREYPVVYVGIPAFKLQVDEDKTPLVDGRTKILVVGTIQPRKGQDLALAALKKMPIERRRQFVVEFIGKVENPDYHRRLLQSTRKTTPANIDQHSVKWTGEATPPKVFEAMCRSDIILVPSREEVTPVVVLEAMSFGRCVVAHDIGGLGEMIQDRVSGRLFRRNDLAHLGEILTELAARPEERLQLGTCGQTFVRQHRTLKQWADQFSELIEHAVRRPGCRDEKLEKVGRPPSELSNLPIAEAGWQ